MVRFLITLYITIAERIEQEEAYTAKCKDHVKHIGQQLEWLLDRVLLWYIVVADTSSLYTVLATYDLTTISDVVLLVKSVKAVCTRAYLSQVQLGRQ